MNFNNLLQYSEKILGDRSFLFKDLVLPTGIDKEVLINNILDKCITHTPIYNDPTLLKAKIENFFARNYDVYKRLLDAFNREYNPIDNYNRSESWTEVGNVKNQNKGTNENKVSAFNSDTYQPNQTNLNDSNANTDTTLTHTALVSGNIGVTTTQKMLELELEVRPKLNIYEIIANDFYNEFMLYTI